MADEDSNAFVLDTSPSHLLHRAQQMAAALSADGLKKAGLTLRQFTLLAAVADSEGASQAGLVDATGIDRSTLADMALRMEQDGYIKRVPAKHDARAKAVTLMAKGRRALEKARPMVAAADAALLEMLPVSRRGGIISSLARLAVGEAVTINIAPAAAAKPKKKKDKKKKKKAAKV